MKCFGLVLAFGLWLCGARASAASGGENDFVLLKDGRLIAKRQVVRAEGGLKLVFANGEVFVPQELVQDYFIDGEPPPAPATEEERAQAAKGNVRFEGRWMSKGQRDSILEKRVEERKQFFADIANRSKWVNRAKVETKHFAFESTLPDHVFERYRSLMEVYFEAFVKDWKIKLPKDLGPLTVCLYSNFEDMTQTGGAGSNVLGYFRFVTPMELDFYHDRLDPLFTEEVMFHETNHYLQKLIDLDFMMPHFPGESLAEYYGASQFDAKTKKLTTGLILEGRLCEVQDDIAGGEWMDLRKLVSTERMYEHYTWGWSLAHFLMSNPKYSKKFQQFVIALPTDGDIRRTRVQALSDNLVKLEEGEIWKAFERYLGLKDGAAIEALQKEWHAHIKDNLKLVTFRGFEEAGKSAAEGVPSRPIKARRLFQTAIDMGSKNPMTFHRYAKVLDDESETRAKAIDMWRQALLFDPLNGEFYGYLGNALIGSGRKDEGERLKKLGVEIDPDARWITIDELNLEEIEPPGK